jgi:hypothetical protein
LIQHVVHHFHERAFAAKHPGFKRPALVLHAGVLPIVEFQDLEEGRGKSAATRGSTPARAKTKRGTD